MTPVTRQKRVLLVDPDSTLRRLRAEVLRRAGYRVLPATNYEDALTRCTAGAYDLIAVSTNGDTSAGLEFCEEVRQRDPQQLVIMVSRPNEYVPRDACPDHVVSEGPEELVEQVSAALAAHS
jgi:DNA-binding response OmpR family regulator